MTTLNHGQFTDKLFSYQSWLFHTLRPMIRCRAHCTAYAYSASLIYTQLFVLPQIDRYSSGRWTAQVSQHDMTDMQRFGSGILKSPLCRVPSALLAVWPLWEMFSTRWKCGSAKCRLKKRQHLRGACHVTSLLNVTLIASTPARIGCTIKVELIE